MSSSSESKSLMKSLLEVICFVRNQRKRPTAERIYLVLRRRPHFKNVTEKKVEAELQAAVSRGELATTLKDGILAYSV
jgi:hypothetical protein